MVQPLIMVVNRDRENTLRLWLTDHIIVQNLANIRRCRDAAIFFGDKRRLCFFADNVIAQIHAFIADEYRWPRNQLADFMLRLSAERAIKRALGIAAAQLGHQNLPATIVAMLQSDFLAAMA